MMLLYVLYFIEIKFLSVVRIFTDSLTYVQKSATHAKCITSQHNSHFLKEYLQFTGLVFPSAKEVFNCE